MTNHDRQPVIKRYESELGNNTVGQQATYTQDLEEDTPEVMHNEGNLCIPVQSTSASTSDSRSVPNNADSVSVWRLKSKTSSADRADILAVKEGMKKHIYRVVNVWA